MKSLAPSLIMFCMLEVHLTELACVARAMFMQPEIILADEPTNNLDPANAKNTIEMLKKIQQETGTTMIIASHDSMVEEYATQIISIKNGHIIGETA